MLYVESYIEHKADWRECGGVAGFECADMIEALDKASDKATWAGDVDTVYVCDEDETLYTFESQEAAYAEYLSAVGRS